MNEILKIADSDYLEAHRMFGYNPTTGKLWRKVTTSSRAQAGDILNTKGAGGYIVVRFLGVPQYVHRIIWLMHIGSWPKQSIDHINHIRHDNRIENLRDVSPSANSHNHQYVYTGVYYAARDDRWVAEIRVDKKRITLGSSKIKEVAESYYREYKKSLKLIHR
jgi:hypothetical protein